MKSYNVFKTITMVIALLSLALGATLSMAASTKIAGQFNQTYTKQEVIPVPQGQGHMLMLTETQGKNSNKGEASYMDGATVVVVIDEIVDLNQGNGPHSGYVTQTMANGDETVTQFSGQVTTTLTADGQPSTTMSGTWKKISGTGQYKGIKGSGTYNGRFISENQYVVDWKGYYFLQ